jgi:PAB-dependent poly(A)-specific ribonuclease subunit 2
MSFTSRGTHELLIAGVQEQMFKIDVEKGQIMEYVRKRDS